MNQEQQEALSLRESGLSRSAIAERMGKTERQVKSLLERARRWLEADPAARMAAAAAGSNTLPHSFWKKDGEYSVYYKVDPQDGAESDLKQMVTDIIADTPKSPMVSTKPRGSGHNLLIIDVADLHYGKLASVSETGACYDQYEAARRMTDGVEDLLNIASPHGVDRILFVTGNDLLHIDNRATTTAGTMQDSDGSMFSMFRGAAAATTHGILKAAELAPVDLLHCPSNHDFFMGWACIQAIAAGLSDHKYVTASDYYISERHRKYYGYGHSGMQFTHGDGAKEESLLPLFRKEARELVANCDFLYSYQHHLHHKISKTRGFKRPEITEKDGIGVVMHNKFIAADRMDATIKVEHVRSPSGTDAWHDRNGYVSRQAVECFMHHDTDGQMARFTRWF